MKISRRNPVDGTQEYHVLNIKIRAKIITLQKINVY